MSSQMAFGISSGVVNLGSAMFSKSADTYSSTAPAFYAAQSLQQQALSQQAALEEVQAGLAIKEANRAAAAKARDVHYIREDQALQYDGSGILLEGSPMEVLNETVRLGKEEVDALVDQGKSQADLIRRSSMIQQNQGIASLLGQTSQFNTGRAQAKIQQSQQKGAAINTALQGLTSVFGSNYGSSPFKAAPKSWASYPTAGTQY